jgi:chaperone modulatory protein CbpM
MSDQEIIPIETCCSYYHIEQTFIQTLEEHGLINIRYEEARKFIHASDVPQLEQFSRLYYDLDINVPGIEALQHLLEKIKALQQDAADLRSRLRIYE